MTNVCYPQSNKVVSHDLGLVGGVQHTNAAHSQKSKGIPKLLSYQQSTFRGWDNWHRNMLCNLFLYEPSWLGYGRDGSRKPDFVVRISSCLELDHPFIVQREGRLA